MQITRYVVAQLKNGIRQFVATVSHRRRNQSCCVICGTWVYEYITHEIIVWLDGREVQRFIGTHCPPCTRARYDRLVEEERKRILAEQRKPWESQDYAE